MLNFFNHISTQKDIIEFIILGESEVLLHNLINSAVRNKQNSLIIVSIRRKAVHKVFLSSFFMLIFCNIKFLIFSLKCNIMVQISYLMKDMTVIRNRNKNMYTLLSFPVLQNQNLIYLKAPFLKLAIPTYMYILFIISDSTNNRFLIIQICMRKWMSSLRCMLLKIR